MAGRARRFWVICVILVGRHRRRRVLRGGPAQASPAGRPRGRPPPGPGRHRHRPQRRSRRLPHGLGSVTPLSIVTVAAAWTASSCGRCSRKARSCGGRPARRDRSPPLPDPAHPGGRRSSPRTRPRWPMRAWISSATAPWSRAASSRSSRWTPRPPRSPSSRRPSRPTRARSTAFACSSPTRASSPPSPGRAGLRLVDRRQHGQGQRCGRARRARPGGADRGGVHDPPGQPAAGARPPARGRVHPGGRLRSRGPHQARDRHAGGGGQPDRRDAPAPSSSRPPSSTATARCSRTSSSTRASWWTRSAARCWCRTRRSSAAPRAPSSTW